MSLKTTIRKKFNKLFMANYKLKKLAAKMIEMQPEIDTPKDGVAAFILAKVYKTHDLALNLAKHGYSEDADMLIRTLFDAVVIISAVTQDETEETALKFMRFDDTIRTKMYNNLRDQPKYKELFEDQIKNPKPESEPIGEIEERAQNWREEYGGGFWQRWHSDSTTGKLAEQVEMRQYFETAYSLQSQLTHSLPRALNYYLVASGDKIVIDIEPKERGVDMSLASAFNMLIVAVDKFNDHFKLGLDAEIKQLVDEWVFSVEEITGS